MNAPPIQRRLSAWTLAVIIMMPAVFGWLVLRKGYAPSLRRAVFLYAIVMTSVGAVGRFSL